MKEKLCFLTFTNQRRMNDMKELAQKITSDKDFEKNAFEYLKKQLDEENIKPSGKRDYDKIAALTAELCELSDGSGQTADDFKNQKRKLYKKVSEYDTKKNRASVKAFRKVIPILCTAAVMLAANCVSVMAWNMNVFSFVVELTRGGVSIDFSNEKDNITLPTSEDDPYGIIAECAKYDIYTETPHYLPEGFELTLSTNNVSDYSNDVKFVYTKGKQSITFDVTRYWGEVGQIGIPSDKYNIIETDVNGYPAVISKEDNQFTLACQIDKTVIFIFTQDVDYSECDKIVASLK